MGNDEDTGRRQETVEIAPGPGTGRLRQASRQIKMRRCQKRPGVGAAEAVNLGRCFPGIERREGNFWEGSNYSTRPARFSHEGGSLLIAPWQWALKRCATIGHVMRIEQARIIETGIPRASPSPAAPGQVVAILAVRISRLPGCTKDALTKSCLPGRNGFYNQYER